MALSVQGTDVLLAAGDIGVGMAGLKWLQRLPCEVVYVAGNHEYWGEDLHSLVQRLNSATQQGNVHYLEKRSVILGDVRFIGCTLWSDFNGADASIMEQMWLAMNDFAHIHKGPVLIQPSDLVSENSRSRDWLEQELDRPFAGKTVVVTHHAPLLRSWYHGHKEKAIQYAYCNDMGVLMERYDIDLWVHGHVHECFDYVAHGVRVVCNPRGYFGYKMVGEFDAGKCILL
jgi:predicted phosphohydrolase